MELDVLLMPFKFGFMQKAFIIALVISVPTALLSCYLVVKGWALMGDAVSHAVLPGIVLAYIFGVPLILGAFVAGMVCSIATGYLTENCRVKQDTIMGVVFSGMFGIGIVLYTAVGSDVHLDHILFGNILGIGDADILVSCGISILVCAGILLKWKDLLVHSFDPAQMRLVGLSNTGIHYFLLAALSLTIVATLTATGLILAIGLLIAPGAIAYLIIRRFGAMLWIAVAVCMTSTFLGIYASFYVDSAPAPTIILILTAFFIIAFIYRLALTYRTSMRQITSSNLEAESH